MGFSFQQTIFRILALIYRYGRQVLVYTHFTQIRQDRLPLSVGQKGTCNICTLDIERGTVESFREAKKARIEAEQKYFIQDKINEVIGAE